MTEQIVKNSISKEYENCPYEELFEKLRGVPAMSEQERVHAELTRRLIKEIKNLNETSSKYSQVIIGLTLALGAIAIIQVILLLK